MQMQYRIVSVVNGVVQSIDGQPAIDVIGPKQPAYMYNPDSRFPAPSWRPPSAADYFNTLGREQWDLTALAPGASADNYTAIFKRPV